MSRSRVYQRCTWFGEGRTSLGDEPKSGRPKTSTNEENKTSVDEHIRCDRRMKIREIALKLEIPKSTVHEIVHDTLRYRKVSARWVPKMLTEDHKLQRVEISQRLLQRCHQDNGDEDTTHIAVGSGGGFQANNNLFDNLITEGYRYKKQRHRCSYKGAGMGSNAVSCRADGMGSKGVSYKGAGIESNGAGYKGAGMGCNSARYKGAGMGSNGARYKGAGMGSNGAKYKGAGMGINGASDKGAGMGSKGARYKDVGMWNNGARYKDAGMGSNGTRYKGAGIGSNGARYKDAGMGSKGTRYRGAGMVSNGARYKGAGMASNDVRYKDVDVLDIWCRYIKQW
ncbi:histone-lysine N-methyltransferase SETMAR [Plakobranchus ocellatus]|uniref:Histone-lysine N-methyltransferase SETMAR n=1 Tax=Plakobranchus ocellatus TaxID=259542 RepID=A0AAV3ZUF9_9GAST|nr:histone-lysine N-methyltransferase SETMAR [Plakobranchus ocellatus]